MLRHIPLLASLQGGVAARSNKKSRSYLVPRSRGGFPFCSQSENHPGLAISGGSAKSFLIARPPLLAVMQGGELRPIPHSFTPSQLPKSQLGCRNRPISIFPP